jgi:nucleoside-triphosphatase THEP1
MKRWALLSGPRGSGKSTTARRAGEALAARGVKVAGFVQEAVDDEEGRAGYLLRRLGHEEALMVARRDSAARAPAEEAFCSFVFDADAFAAARRWLAEDAAARVVIIDEVSKLEVAGRGHHDAIAEALSGDRLVLLAVRADQLFAVMERFGLDEPVAALETAEPAGFEAFVSSVAGAAL